MAGGAAGLVYHALHSPPRPPLPSEIAEIEVDIPDARVGEPIIIRASRQNIVSHLADWRAEVHRLRDGDYSQVNACRGSGRDNYSVDEDYPVGIDLDWWLEHNGRGGNRAPGSCRLTAGQYRLSTSWTISTPAGPVAIWNKAYFRVLR